MKTTLTLAAMALLAGTTFAAAQSPMTPQKQQQPTENGQKVERNPSGAVGGSKQNPSPTGMKKRVQGPRTGGPQTINQAEERNPSGATGGSKRHPSPTTGSSRVRGPKSNQPLEANQAEERNPSGKTGGSKTNPSPR